MTPWSVAVKTRPPSTRTAMFSSVILGTDCQTCEITSESSDRVTPDGSSSRKGAVGINGLHCRSEALDQPPKYVQKTCPFKSLDCIKGQRSNCKSCAQHAEVIKDGFKRCKSSRRVNLWRRSTSGRMECTPHNHLSQIYQLSPKKSSVDELPTGPRDENTVRKHVRQGQSEIYLSSSPVDCDRLKSYCI